MNTRTRHSNPRSKKPSTQRVLRSRGCCPTCGKVRYPDRKSARDARRLHPSEHLRAYECDGYWHLGHPRIHNIWAVEETNVIAFPPLSEISDEALATVEESNVVALRPRDRAVEDDDQAWAA
jgi:hypothetical protein